MIKINNLSFKYDDLVIFNNFSLSLDEQKVHCIFAPSASGKTTLLNLIAKLLQPNSGTISSNNYKVSYLFQDNRLIEQLTVYDNLSLILKSVYHNETQIEKIIKDGLKYVGLDKYINSYPNQLSGSEKRRLALIRAFIYPSKILLMDEPFNGLDLNIKREVISYFIKLWNKDKKTVIFVTHDIDELLTISHQAHIFSNKPMVELEKINISSSNIKRDLVSKELVGVRKKIFDVIDKKW